MSNQFLSTIILKIKYMNGYKMQQKQKSLERAKRTPKEMTSIKI